MRQRLALFMVLAAVAITTLLFWGVKDNHMMRLEAPATKTGSNAVSATSINTDTVTDKPQFNGEDAKGHTWQLNAERATQSGTVSDSTVGLDVTHGWWVNSNTTILGKADHGDYYPDQKYISLKGHVQIETSDTIVQSPAMKADMTSQEISGTSTVSLTHMLTNQTMHATAQNFVVEPQTKKATLTGNVHVRLEPKE